MLQTWKWCCGATAHRVKALATSCDPTLQNGYKFCHVYGLENHVDKTINVIMGFLRSMLIRPWASSELEALLPHSTVSMIQNKSGADLASPRAIQIVVLVGNVIKSRVIAPSHCSSGTVPARTGPRPAQTGHRPLKSDSMQIRGLRLDSGRPKLD